MNAITFTESKMPGGMKMWTLKSDGRTHILRIKNRFGNYYYDVRFVLNGGIITLGSYVTFDEAVAKVGA